MPKREQYTQPNELPSETSGLTTGALIGAAKEDLQRRIRNKSGRAVCDMEPYAFDRKHVAKANTEVELLKKALDDRGHGLSSQKKWTRMIYRDKDILEKAHETALIPTP